MFTLRRLTTAAAVAVALLTAAPASAGAAAAEGYPVTGTLVTGTEQQDPAAPLLPPGQYTEVFDRGESGTVKGTARYYRIPTPALSRIRVGATLPLPTDRGTESGSVGVRLELFDVDGSSCTSQQNTTGLTNTSDADLVVTTLTQLIDPEGTCGDREFLHLRVQRIGDGLAQEPLPVELVVRIEPDASIDGLPEPFKGQGPALPIPLLADVTTAVDGGRSFVDAAPVTTGTTYRDTLRTGESRFYRVPLSWGQRLTYLVRDSGPTRPAEADPETVAVNVFDPLRRRVDGAAKSASMFDDDLDQVTASTPHPIRYRNRENSVPLSVAGDHYLVVTASPADEDGPIAETTITFTVVVSGDVDPEPRYRDLGRVASMSEAAGSSEAVTGVVGTAGSSIAGSVGGSVDGSVQSSGGAQASSDDDDAADLAATGERTGPDPLTWWAVGGIVVIAAGVVVLLLRRRQTH